MEISPVTLYRIGTCCHMINRITFVNPSVYDKFARAAFNSLMCDLGNFANVSANTHSLLSLTYSTEKCLLEEETFKRKTMISLCGG